MDTPHRILHELVGHAIGSEAAAWVAGVLTLPDMTGDRNDDSGSVPRAVLAQALNMVLFHDLLMRVPSGRRYTEEAAAAGRKVFHDHGALRTVRWMHQGALPPGECAFTRILEPLGYRLNGVFPLERIGMTGRSYAHRDDPAGIAQFFVSELHPEKFSPQFQATVTRVLQSALDPLPPAAQCMLHELARDGRLAQADALALLPQLQRCFGRQHATPHWSDYQLLLAESAEMAWIATEGNAFNHVTDRVADLDELVARQNALQRRMKPSIEVSRSGRVRQTAFLADPVQRTFIGADGAPMEQEVPGSFYEFIARDMHIDEATGTPRLDLGFDAGNAQGIFRMTAAAPG